MKHATISPVLLLSEVICYPLKSAGNLRVM